MLEQSAKIDRDRIYLEQIQEQFRLDPSITLQDMAQRLNVARTVLKAECEQHVGGYLGIRSRVIEDAPVVAYHLTPEEIAEKYGPPKRQPGRDEDVGRPSTIDRDAILAAIRRYPAANQAEIAGLAGCSGGGLNKWLVRNGGLEALRKEALAGMPVSEAERPTAIENPGFEVAEVAEEQATEQPGAQKPEEPEPSVAACRVCGCTNERACFGGCSWVEPDLCSRCAAREAAEAAQRAPAPAVRQEHVIDGRMSLARLMSIVLALRGLSDEELQAEVWLRVSSEG